MVLVGFLAGIVLGIVIATAWWIFLPAIMDFFMLISLKRESRKPIDFRKMPDPPDEGIEQRLYKPRGTPAEINKSALGRRHPRP